ncbi:hypothetical protein V1477_021032 [Vespula maculifrons]|uniref:Uncharacterized protein n=1 Tax=Vespula maculifrons TaxID=7453 RepID=A0ABD2API1_VESMC
MGGPLNKEMKKLMQTARCSTSDYFMSISGNGVICDGIFLRKQINVFKIWELSLGEFSSISIVNTSAMSSITYQQNVQNFDKFDVALNDFLDHNVLIDGIVAIVTMDKEDMELKR